MPHAVERADEELIEDYLEGDTDAFRLLIERYHDPLLRFLFRFLGNRQAAEDVFQETFLQVHQSLETFDRQRTFKPWLFTIAANKGRDSLRRSQRRSMVSLSAGESQSQSGGLVDLLEIEVPSPGSRLEQEEQSRDVQKAVDQLPPRLREILLLAYFQKMTYSQMAEVFGIPVGTVKSRLHAAVAAFAKAWKARRGDESSQQHRRTGGPHEH